MGYDKFEARERVEYGNGTKTDYAYNPLNRRLTGLLAKAAADPSASEDVPQQQRRRPR